jgi:5-(aminomethyl)-3-furanmethanol phosphate kinase
MHALDLTARVVAALVSGLEVVAMPEENAAVWQAGRTPVLAPRRFMELDDQRSADPLPHSWDVTSDSIAARLARQLGAQELVLLKSAPLPPCVNRLEAVRMGLVDPAFPVAAEGIRRVLYLNLRDPGASPIAL